MPQLIAAAEPISRPARFMFYPAVNAGFPSPALDFEEGILDIGEYLIRHPAASYWFRVGGDCLKGAGIHHDDLVLIDSAVRPSSRRIVLAKLNGEYTLKRYMKRKDRIWLVPDPEGADYPSIEVNEEADFSVFGVMSSLVRTYF